MRISDWSSDVCSSDLLFDRSAKQLLKLSEHQGAALYAAQDFSPDGSHLLYTSNEGSEFARLRRYNLADASHTDVESADWDITYAWYSQSGRYRVRDRKSVV